jgi:enamine deaminase RidA (YjgF/YER057c/UK114 family)
MTQGAPKPQGDYVAASRHGDLLVTAGVTPRRDGVMQHAGHYASGDAPDRFRAGAELAAANLIALLDGAVAEGEEIAGLLSLSVYVAAAPGFTDHARVADFASAILRERYGAGGRCARAAVGVASLPGGACVEMSAQAVIRKSTKSTESGSLAARGIPVYKSTVV